MKKLICILLVVLLLLSLSVTVFAAINPVVDNAGILTEEERYQLIQMLAPYGNKTIQIVTVESLEGENIEVYAENCAENTGVGVLCVVAVQERKWCITTSPAYEDAIDGYVIDLISAECVPYLQEDDYYGAFEAFAEECGYYLDGYDPSAPMDVDDEGGGFFGRFLICLVIGLAAGGITAGIMAGRNKSVRPKNSAADYVRSGSLQVTVSRDIYLYHHITRTPKPQNNSSSGGGGSRSTRSGGF